MIDGPDNAPATLILAHGAGAPMDSPFMAAIARGLAESHWRVVRFEFACMQSMQRMRQRPLFIGGKSMGGRVASYAPSTWPPCRRQP